MSSYPPYAGPAGATVSASGHRPDLRRPYVPAPWRSSPEAAADADVSTAVAEGASLPSIDAFLAQSHDPVMPGANEHAGERAGEPLAEDARERIAPSAPFAIDDALHADPRADDGAPVDSDAIVAGDDSALRGEDWAMSDAAADVVSLVAGMGAHESARDASPLLPPLPMWSDDDMLDIMPVPRPTDEEAAARLFGEEQGSTGQGDGAADFRGAGADAIGGYQDAIPDADVPQGSEAAAAVLETLARRIRDGELPIPGYAPGMGDAAALAAALASLLGLRR